MQLRLTPAVKGLLFACLGAFVIQQTVDIFFGGNLLSWLALIPAKVVLELKLWQLVTYAFLHGDVMHLFLNLMMLVFIGADLESVWGTARFLRYYLFCAVFAGMFYLFLQTFVSQGLHTPMVGASGGIYGLLMAYGILFGERTLLFMMLFPMKAKHFVWILAGVEFLTTLFASRAGLASAAHLGGMFAGFAYLWGWAAWRLARKRREERSERRGIEARQKARKASGLKLVVDNEKRPKTGTDDFDDNGGSKTWH